MGGFSCTVCGRLDPSEFFSGMLLTFGAVPHLNELKTSIEVRVVDDGLVPDGSDYGVIDIEILDLRLNMWIPLDARSQLYSGCQLAAIRDGASATAAGQVERVGKRLDTKVMGFALEARRLFDTLDAEAIGEVTLKSMLRSLRHDPNYAIDLFNILDQRGTGRVTYMDFMAAFNDRDSTFWHELALRLEHGGTLPGPPDRSSTIFAPVMRDAKAASADELSKQILDSVDRASPGLKKSMEVPPLPTFAPSDSPDLSGRASPGNTRSLQTPNDDDRSSVAASVMAKKLAMSPRGKLQAVVRSLRPKVGGGGTSIVASSSGGVTPPAKKKIPMAPPAK